jgi:hypothetical protein
MAHKPISEHDVVVELLPWYVKNTLSPAERIDVDQHLSACQDCQLEIMLYQQLEKVTAVKAPKPGWQPNPAQFSQIMQGIDEFEKQTATTVKANKAPSGLVSKLSAWFEATPTPVFWFMSLETVALTVLILILGRQLPAQLGGNSFETLSNGEPAASASLPRLHLVFSEDITERELRALLQAQQGQLVQGPSLLGVYTVQLAKGGANEVQQAIANLRANPKVKLVESLDNRDRP